MRGVSLSAASYNPALCNVCGSSSTSPLLAMPAPALTSDGQIVDAAIDKIECVECGLVRNAAAIDAEHLAAHYASYKLGVAATAGEPLFFTATGVQPRSQVIFQWIHDAYTRVRGSAPSSVLEIGCGEGSVLARAVAAWPRSTVTGLDMSAQSIAAAQVRGLSAKVGSYADAIGPQDLIYAFAVIEHVPSPAHFLQTLAECLSPEGVLVIAQPCQDRGSNDIFFVDHLYHFMSRHIAALGRGASLVELRREVGQPLVPDFSLHVFGRSGTAQPESPLKIADIRTTIQEWQSVFERINGWLDATAGRPLAVWGLGQTFQMLCAYTRLRDASITIGLDDNPGRFAGQLPMPVAPLEAAQLSGWPGLRVLLTFSPGEAVVARLRALGVDWFSPLEVVAG